MRFGGIDEQGADVGFFDGGEGAKGGEFFDANFALAGLAKAGGVEDFERAAVVTDLDAVDVAGGALAGGDKGLLFLAEGVEKAGFADVGAADEGKLQMSKSNIIIFSRDVSLAPVVTGLGPLTPRS